MELEPIPGPRGLPFLGNLLDLKDEDAPLNALNRLAETYGEIFQITVKGKHQVIVSTAELMKELMNEKKFMKSAIPALHRPDRPDGLIIASTLDPDWEQAHRVLRPAFGPIKIEDMFDDMKDIAHQLIMKWARFGGNEEIALTEDLSNLTLDTIALCTMDYRFNSFYREGAHPYVAAMGRQLGAAGGKQRQIPLLSNVLSLFGAGGVDQDQMKRDNAFMQKTAQDIIENRRSAPEKKNDFLTMLLYGKDPKTGEVMRDELIRAQMQTFLVAGHETTSGLLSFCILFMLQHPETFRKAQDEVDRVVGHGPLEIHHIRELEYITGALRETLRLIPTAPMVGKVVPPWRQGEVVTIGGKYQIGPDDRVMCLLGKAMQDPTVFGEDAREFKPERMTRANPDYEHIDPYWRPFSEGSRACLGRPFSIQEAIIALTLIIQNFDLRLSDPMYKLHIHQNITVKPEGLFIKAALRHGLSPLDVEKRLHMPVSISEKSKKKAAASETVDSSGHGNPLTILFGSNQGTCQALAQRLAADAAASYGFNPNVVDMDAAVGQLSKEHPTIIVTSSYEGEPPDNALHFVHWLESLRGNELEGVQYAVFGCGHKDWHATFHRIPKLVDETMKARGAKHIADIGLTDVSQNNPIGDFETWLDETLSPVLKKLSPNADAATEESDISHEAEISTGERAAMLHQDLHVGMVKESRLLTAAGEEPPKRHMEVELPSGMTYECGDYLAILPQSPEDNVRAVMAHFKLPNDATITFKSKVFSPLPQNTSLSVAELLREYYELAKPATRRGLVLALKYTTDESVRKILQAWIDDPAKLRTDITETNTSIFELLRKHPEIAMPISAFMSLLQPLGIRQYSISSSPLKNPESCSITYSVIHSHNPDHPFHGVASTYLSTLSKGDRIQVSVRKTAKQAFRLPLDTAKTPLLMFAAGTGVAPFRGFLEQRAIQLAANPNTQLAPAHLFIGCRSSSRDRLYADEMDRWARQGVVNLHYAFSREPEKSEGCAHVADRYKLESGTAAKAWKDGARVYVCGNRGLAQSITDAATEIVGERMKELKTQEGWSEERTVEERKKIFGAMRARAADDVFD